jgi:hypothetical protein
MERPAALSGAAQSAVVRHTYQFGEGHGDALANAAAPGRFGERNEVRRRKRGSRFIGLDFAGEPGDLKRVARQKLPPTQTDYWDFAHTMKSGDRVLIIVHHFPFALVTVDGDYSYISAPEPELGVWFRHFRRINKSLTSYFGDRLTNVRQWDQYTMTDTISVLKDPDGQSNRLIRGWVADLNSAAV